MTLTQTPGHICHTSYGNKKSGFLIGFSAQGHSKMDSGLSSCWSANSTRDGGMSNLHAMFLSADISYPPTLHRRLIIFWLDVESGALRDTVAYDLPNTGNSSPSRLRGGTAFLFIPDLALVFCTRTRHFYKFPEFRIALVCRAETNLAWCPKAH